MTRVPAQVDDRGRAPGDGWPAVPFPWWPDHWTDRLVVPWRGGRVHMLRDRAARPTGRTLARSRCGTLVTSWRRPHWDEWRDPCRRCWPTAGGQREVAKVLAVCAEQVAA